MTRVVFRNAALTSLSNIIAYIADNNPDRAETFRQELIDRCISLSHAPERGTPTPEHGHGIRRLSHGNYLIFYRYDHTSDTAHILYVVHGSRDLSALSIDTDKP